MRCAACMDTPGRQGERTVDGCVAGERKAKIKLAKVVAAVRLVSLHQLLRARVRSRPQRRGGGDRRAGGSGRRSRGNYGRGTASDDYAPPVGWAGQPDGGASTLGDTCGGALTHALAHHESS